MILTTVAFAIAVANPAAADSVSAQMASEPDVRLASASLAQGREGEAIRVLESELAANPDDPAILINLGIAHAQRGDDTRARALFRAAMASEEAIDLETASGHTSDSRRLARRALGMLDRGEFRPAVGATETLTLRD
ncbi:tetratricopeptide repeat protein [Erythrobacter sp. GH1-10]|uniref:tetratricopeptide repeat protein n=1 Tax=Erythrobacter sp. GH1-10 TaxID=3349334 RepID=UPI00387804FE